MYLLNSQQIKKKQKAKSGKNKLIHYLYTTLLHVLKKKNNLPFMYNNTRFYGWELVVHTIIGG